MELFPLVGKGPHWQTSMEILSPRFKGYFWELGNAHLLSVRGFVLLTGITRDYKQLHMMVHSWPNALLSYSAQGFVCPEMFSQWGIMRLLQD
jgi:hypothetical protein